jgi:hypothetical protein
LVHQNRRSKIFSLLAPAALILATAAFAEQVATPSFNYNSGKYHSPIAVIMQCATPGATTYYTTDGTPPTSTSARYDGSPILVANHVSGDSFTQMADNDPDPYDDYQPQTFVSLTINAIAMKAGMENSNVARADYVIDLVEATFNVPYDAPPAAGGTKHWLDIYQPHGRSKTPVLFFIHGGAWKDGDKNIYMELGNTFAGYYHVNTVVANYQLSTEPWNAVHPTHIQDVAKAFAWVYGHIAEFGGDPSNIFVFGQSAGGHLLSLLATDETYLQTHGLAAEKIKGVVTMSGAYDLSDLVKWPANPLGLSSVEVLAYKALCQNTFGSWDESVLNGASPAQFVNAKQPPLLIINLQESGDFKDMPGFGRDAENFYALIKSLNGPQAALKQLAVTDIPPEIVAVDFPGEVEGHYEEIYAINTKYWSSVSTRMVADFITSVPAIPRLKYPLPGASDILLDPTLIWQAAERATSYHLQLAADSTFSSEIVFDGALADTTWRLSGLTPGRRYFWRVKAQNALGESGWSTAWSFATINTVKVAESIVAVPEEIALNIHPNPFNPTATVQFSIPSRQYVTLKIFDALGREVITLWEGNLEAGSHALRFAPHDLAGGLYFYKLTAGKFLQTRKAVLIK